MSHTVVSSSLSEQLSAVPSKMPPAAREIMGRTVAHIASVAPGLPVGAHAPDLILPDQLGWPRVSR